MREAAKEENLSRSGKIKKKLTEIWDLLEPYRLGFGLGALAVSATVLMVLTGQKSEKLNYFSNGSPAKVATLAPQKDVVPVTQESGSSAGPVLGAQDIASEPATVNKTAAKPASKPSASGKINVNTASVSILDALPYVRPAVAKAIVEYRAQYGPFKAIEELMRVKGIKEGIFGRIKNRVTVE